MIDLEAIRARIAADVSMRKLIFESTSADEMAAWSTRQREIWQSLCDSIRDRDALLAEVERLRADANLAESAADEFLDRYHFGSDDTARELWQVIASAIGRARK
jgi:hypothetical protein